MFTVTRQFIDWEGSLYWIKRQIKEENINSDLIHEFKEYLGADTVLKKNGYLFYVMKVDEAEVIELGQVNEAQYIYYSKQSYKLKKLYVTSSF